MLTAQDVVSAYKLLLGREPETPAVIEGYVAGSNFDQMRQVLLSSSEFAGRLRQDPYLLAIPTVSFAITRQARTYRRALESLYALELPLAEKSVLIVGDDAASLVPFFLDRLCRVTISASRDTLRLVEILLASLGGAATGNTTLIENGLAGLERGDADRTGYDVVYAEMPEADEDQLETWLDDVTDVCAGILILNCALAPGRSENIFFMQGRKRAGFAAVPTRKWIVNRLAERLPFVYAPRSPAGCLADAGADLAANDRVTAVLLSSREALDSLESAKCSGDQAESRIAARI